MRARGRWPTVAVLGAGAGGIAVAVRLRKAGIRDFVVYEAGGGVGGTWRHNVYPGAACDVMSHLYSYSFAPSKDWTRTYATQPEILRYLEGVADRFGVRQHVRTSNRVHRLRWTGTQWEITTAAGDVERYDVVISALGLFSQAAHPDLPGLDDFAGRLVHTSEWDPTLDVGGLRVGVVGTGASAVQVVPELAAAAEHLTVFQRTPAWMLPKVDRVYDEKELRRFRRMPGAAKLTRFRIWRLHHQETVVRIDDPRTAQRQAWAQAYLHHKVADPELRAKLTPDYPFGCKRVLTGGRYYAALQQPNADLVTAKIERLTAGGVRTADGHDHEVDVLVLATGFETTKYLHGIEVIGRDGRRLHDEWAKRPEAYLGTAISGYPNLFLLYGPNTNQGGNSIIGILEAGARYAVSAIRALRRDPRPLDVRSDVQRAYNDQLQADLRGSVWEACDSYFRTAEGRIVTQWPHTSLDYARRTWRLRRRDYERLVR